MISILLGCGLRRAELVSLRKEDIQIGEGHWAIVDLVGKGGHVRTVPVPVWVKSAVDRWMAAADVTDGCVFRAVSRRGIAWGKGVSENVVSYVVRNCASERSLIISPLTICGGHAQSCVTSTEASCSTSSSFSATPQF